MKPVVMRVVFRKRPSFGYFGSGDEKPLSQDRKNIITEWDYCRETFHKCNRHLRYFYYTHEIGKLNHIRRFFERIEATLDIQPRSQFGPTQRKTISWIVQSPWWWKQSMRRSLFTVFLRAALEYNSYRDNFEEALFGVDYTSDTRLAVSRFLAGYTHYRGRKHEWCEQFEEATIETVERLLVLPKSNS